jgi:hypothetical protein
MQPFIYIQSHMLQTRVQISEKQLEKDFRHNESLMARLIPILRKEAAEKDDDEEEEEDKEAWPSRSSDNNSPVSPIRFPRVKCWFKCPTCLNYLYVHKNNFLFHVVIMNNAWWINLMYDAFW